MFDGSCLKQIIVDQQEERKLIDNIPRQQFNKIQELSQSRLIVIVMGIRRCGKSTLMQQIQSIQPEQDFCLSFEDERLISFNVEDFQILLEIFIELFGEQKTLYFDEIQNIEGWELFIRRMHDYGYKIYLTGSNANLLSRELGTHLTGRYVTVELYPYAFAEYCVAKQHSIDVKRQTTTQKSLQKKWLNEYQTDGGFPEYLQNPINDYLRTLYENILYRDIINRYNLPHEKPIKELVVYLASNIGKTITYNRLSKTLGLSSGATVQEYCGYLENCYLFFLLYRYDPSLKKQLIAPKKSYIIDTALARILGFRASEDKGRFLENMVFIELKRRFADNIYYHQGKYECDFIIREGIDIIQAIQVTQHLQGPETREREYRGLLDAMQTYGLLEGIILTENELGVDKRVEAGKAYHIQIMPIAQWLLLNDALD
jgi:uncharacterized protein